ncbi:PREDICTED: pyrin domain-containing protein 3-like [Myotis brandtii]|uniref:pyrin domain-containing protein 3-like n=1 Tax=Myotis brandtii TaxID=109478 RepID=UPI000704019E|nr:PREDICTED: pyrin domain-containing protein 3-like [Myotis brandtii]
MQKTRRKKEQCSQFGYQSITCVTTMDPEKLLVPSFKRLRVAPMTAIRKRKMTKATQGTKVPTWGQLKKLTTEAQQMVEKQDAEATPSIMFLAMLALVSCQSSAKSCTAKSKDSE